MMMPFLLLALSCFITGGSGAGITGSTAVEAAVPSAPWTPPRADALPAYVISLKRSPARFKVFARDGKVKSLFPRLEVLDAVDGRDLHPRGDPRFSLTAQLNLQRGTRRSHSDIVTPGMAGLYISHVMVWKRLLEDHPDDAMAIVFEDDAVVEDALPGRMDAVLAQLPPPSEWDVWVLGAVRVVKAAQGPKLAPGIQVVTEYYGTQAYVISRRGAQRLLDLAYPLGLQVDAFMSQATFLQLTTTLWRADGLVNVAQTYRFLGSTVQQTYCDLCDLPEDYSRLRDVLWWVGLGVAGALGAPRLRTARWVQVLERLLTQPCKYLWPAGMLTRRVSGPSLPA